MLAARTTLFGRRLVSSVLHTQRAAFHVAIPLFDEAKIEKVEEADKDISTAAIIDKENPMYAPDTFEPWRNAGYKNVAPAGWTRWDDLEAPYDRYQVRVDKADVENPGLFWKIMTNWRMGIPVAFLLSFPAWAYEVVLLDERFELMLIFWSFVAIANHSFGPAIKKTFTDSIDEIRTELTTAQSKHVDTIEDALDTYTKAKSVPEYLSMVNAGERALKKVEAESRTRAVHIAERNQMVEMLDYLVTAKNSRDAKLAEEVTSRARVAVEAKLNSDSGLVQTTLTNAIAALGSSKVSDSVVEDLYTAEFAAAQAAIHAELAKSATASDADRELFAKRFGFGSATVTQDQVDKAASDPAARAVLLAKTGGAEPAVGAPIVQKMPIDY